MKEHDPSASGRHVGTTSVAPGFSYNHLASVYPQNLCKHIGKQPEGVNLLILFIYSLFLLETGRYLIIFKQLISYIFFSKKSKQLLIIN